MLGLTAPLVATGGLRGAAIAGAGSEKLFLLRGAVEGTAVDGALVLDSTTPDVMVVHVTVMDACDTDSET